jgi:hypothetical protein
MKFAPHILAGFSLLASTSASSATTPYKPKYRISPIDGSKIALPTKEQLAFQDKEIGVLIHFNLATYLSIDGCNNVPNLVPKVSLFDPTLLNTDQWMDTISSLGAKYATLVAKHNCGFTIWPSDVTFTDRENKTVPYSYTIAQSPVHGENVVRSFVNSAEKYNIGHGFYYSVVVNNYLNVQNSEVRPNTWAQGQVNITNGTYDQIVYDQLTELWTNYGKLTEVRKLRSTLLTALLMKWSLVIDLVRWWLQRHPAGQDSGSLGRETAPSCHFQRMRHQWNLHLAEFQYVGV